jgi:CubicO group peptidase (beta-lactamase class C family)
VGEQFGRGPRGAIGHLGFTGSSLWIDLDDALVVALVTNRTAHGRDNVAGIRALRPAVHTAALGLRRR